MSTGSSAERLQAFREAAAKTKGFQCITALFDEGTFNEVDGFAKSGDGSAEEQRCGWRRNVEGAGSEDQKDL